MSAISQPLMKAPLGGTPQQSAQMYTANQASSQASLARAVGGRRRIKIKRGGSGVPAPQMLTPYPVAGAGDQNPNAIMLKNAGSQNQGGANAVYDNSARTMKGGCAWGGGRKRKTKRHFKNQKWSKRRRVHKQSCRRKKRS